MRSPRRVCSALCLALPLLPPVVAMAQPPDAAAGRALFQEARTLFEQGRTDEACAKFEESERVDPAPGTELGLAACWEKQGRVASAWAMFGRAEASSMAANRAEWAEHARRKAAELAPGLPKIRLRIGGASPAEGVDVRWDGEAIPRDRLADAVPVDPGTHRLDVSRPSHRSRTITVTVPPGPQLLDVDVPALEAVPPAPPAGNAGPARVAAGDSMPPLRIAGVAALGAGAVGLALGAYFGVSAFSHDSDARDECPTPTTCSSRGLDADESARSAATVSTVAFAIGAAAVIGGIVLIVVAPKTQSRPRAAALAVAW